MKINTRNLASAFFAQLDKDFGVAVFKHAWFPGDTLKRFRILLSKSINLTQEEREKKLMKLEKEIVNYYLEITSKSIKTLDNNVLNNFKFKKMNYIKSKKINVSFETVFDDIHNDITKDKKHSIKIQRNGRNPQDIDIFKHRISERISEKRKILLALPDELVESMIKQYALNYTNEYNKTFATNFEVYISKRNITTGIKLN